MATSGAFNIAEYRGLVEAAESPMAMWIDLRLKFEEAMDARNTELVSRVLSFAAWCISEQSGRLPNDISTAASVAFYEHLPEKREYWEFFRKWFSAAQFETLLPVFSYHLNAQDLTELKQVYASTR